MNEKWPWQVIGLKLTRKVVPAVAYYRLVLCLLEAIIYRLEEDPVKTKEWLHRMCAHVTELEETHG